MLKSNSGQNLMEVGVLIAMIVGVLMSMQIYIQRSFQAKYKAGADYLHNEIVKAAPALAGTPRQYDPYYSESWEEDRQIYDRVTGFPNTVVDETAIQRGWATVNVPGEND